MIKRTLIASALASFLMLPAGLALAAEQEAAQEKTEDKTQDKIQEKTQDKTQAQQQVTGRQLMTQQEHTEFRDKMRAANTAEERRQIQKEQHERMRERARARNLSMPEQPRRAPRPQQVTGREFMTQQEHAEFRDKMRAARTAEERRQIQNEQHERMQERARARNLSMPEQPRRAPRAQQVTGRQLMTQQEHTEFRDKMRAARTAEERRQIQNEQHERMQERARARNLTLPDEPPARRGGGMGYGQGRGR